jgi:uncharacterized protein YpuA (DUF1002 family)
MKLRRILVVLAAALAFSVASLAPNQAAGDSAAQKSGKSHSKSASKAEKKQAKEKTYKNKDGEKVKSPRKADKTPKHATAKCADGTYSFSKHASGACFSHGGVDAWINKPNS